MTPDLKLDPARPPLARLTRIKIAILGAGNMGTAMAHVLACDGHEVTLWDFFPEVIDDIRLRFENRRFLPGIRLHEGVRATTHAGECVAGGALVVVGVPSPFVISTLAPVVPACELAGAGQVPAALAGLVRDRIGGVSPSLDGLSRVLQTAGGIALER